MLPKDSRSRRLCIDSMGISKDSLPAFDHLNRIVPKSSQKLFGVSRAETSETRTTNRRMRRRRRRRRRRSQRLWWEEPSQRRIQTKPKHINQIKSPIIETGCIHAGVYKPLCVCVCVCVCVWVCQIKTTRGGEWKLIIEAGVNSMAND